jgi:hypothetical protein
MYEKGGDPQMTQIFADVIFGFQSSVKSVKSADVILKQLFRINFGGAARFLAREPFNPLAVPWRTLDAGAANCRGSG